uniref:Ribosomal protein S3 n=1 Tax=Cyanophora sudae TaxID=1522369 RepID=A0A873WRR9_9EUKA|nr:ribosomal protein S3 [Cyanophora sudae]QPB15055.1 ribosomal protein S3 [Cyanophora sudae]
MGKKINPILFRLNNTAIDETIGLSFNSMEIFFSQDYIIKKYIKAVLKKMKIIFSEINIYRSLSNIIIYLKIFSFRKPWFFKIRTKLRLKRKKKIKKKISFILKKIQKWIVTLTGLKTQLVIYRSKSLNLYPEMINLLIQKSFKQRKNFRIIFRKTIFHIQKRFKQGIVGAKISLSGRLGKSQIARTEWIQSNNPFGGKSQLPLHTINNNIIYSYKTIYSKRGTIGVKTWLFLRPIKEVNIK